MREAQKAAVSRTPKVENIGWSVSAAFDLQDTLRVYQPTLVFATYDALRQRDDRCGDLDPSAGEK